MKKPLFTVFAAASFIVLAGCAKEHIIATEDGRMIDTANKPTINDDTGMVEYKDLEGRKNQIPNSEVTQIKQR